LEEASSRVAGPDGRSLIAYLQHAGLVRLHLWEQVDFVHLTFQEFYLAQALMQHGLLQALQRHWGEARYEETLGLLISLLWQDGQYTDIDQGIRWLVASGEAAHRHTPHMLWQHRRSPLRVALHLLYRAGVSLEHLPTTAGFLWEKICSSQARKEATAVDAKTPPCILRALAQEAIPQDPKSLIRLFVARNPSTPPAVLAQLAQDAEIANWLVLDNPSVLLEDL